MSKQAATYPTEEQYRRWKARADEMGMSLSEWLECMVEAGQKKFDASVRPDESVEELREQRNDLRQELGRARDRIEKLERKLHHGERGMIIDYVHSNPGAEFDEIIQHTMENTPSRVSNHMDDLVGSELVVEDEKYYPIEQGE